MAEYAATLATHGHLFTMRGDGVGYVDDGAVAVKGGRIAAVGSTPELTVRFQAAEIIDATGCAVLPGLIDAHMHTPLAIVRGVAQDVKHWMQRALAQRLSAHHEGDETVLARHQLVQASPAACLSLPEQDGLRWSSEAVRRQIMVVRVHWATPDLRCPIVPQFPEN